MMNQPRDHFRVLRLLHLSILAGFCLFGIVALSTTETGTVIVAEESHSRNLQIAALIFSFSMLFIGYNIFKKKIMAARTSDKSAEQRLMQYKKACFRWWVMIEAPGFFAMICYMLTANLSFFFLGIFHLLILFVFMPRKGNIILLLNLDNGKPVN